MKTFTKKKKKKRKKRPTQKSDIENLFKMFRTE